MFVNKYIPKRLRNIIMSNEESLRKYCIQILKAFKYKPIIGENFIIGIGKGPACIISHLDTVHNSPPKNILYDKELDVIWSPDGLGADDRAGVWATTEILIKTNYRPSIIFTQGEEIGGVGAVELVSKIERPKEIEYLIQLDRANSLDAVYYGCHNTEFQNWVESFGFKRSIGSFTDISIIMPEWDIAGVNLSVGYYNQHTLKEYLKIKQTIITIEKVIKMLSNPILGQQKYQGIETNNINMVFRYFKTKNRYKEQNEICGHCLRSCNCTDSNKWSSRFCFSCEKSCLCSTAFFL